MKKAGLRAFGPNREAPGCEGSKAWSKMVMTHAAIPTAEYRTFTRPDDAFDYMNNHEEPLVVKASGLAAGKGVFRLRQPGRGPPGGGVDHAGPGVRRRRRLGRHRERARRAKRPPSSPSSMIPASTCLIPPRTTRPPSTATAARTPAAWGRTAPPRSSPTPSRPRWTARFSCRWCTP